MQRLSVRQACTKTCLPFSFFFSLVLTVHFRGRWRGKRRTRSRRANKTSTKPVGLTHSTHCSLCTGKAILYHSADYTVKSSPLNFGVFFLLQYGGGVAELHLNWICIKAHVNNQSACKCSKVMVRQASVNEP